MATHLRKGTSIEDVSDICDAIHSGLDSDPKTKHLSPTWQTFTEDADGLAAEKKALGRDKRRARVGLAVSDALWDPEMAAFGRRVVDDSGGRRDQPPYTRFFSDISPSAAQQLRPDNEVAFGKKCLNELARDPNEPLAQEWTPRLSLVNTSLETAINTKNALDQREDQLDVSIDLLIQKINPALDILEGDLKKLFPGNPKRVASYLTATRI